MGTIPGVGPADTSHDGAPPSQQIALPIVVRAMQAVARFSGPYMIGFVGALAILMLLQRWDLVFALFRVNMLAIGVLVAFWLTYVVKICRDLGRAADMRIVDVSGFPAPLPPDLEPAAAQLIGLGFAPIGQTESYGAWPEKMPRRYAKYASLTNPAVSAELGFTGRRTVFGSWWLNGHTLETGCPSLDLAVPAGVTLFPDCIHIQQSDDGPEATYRLHLAAVAAQQAAIGSPIPVCDLPTAMALVQRSHRQMADFHLAKRRPLIRQAFFIVPSWTILTWLVFALHIRP
jgi:hypothetical protein